MPKKINPTENIDQLKNNCEYIDREKMAKENILL